MKKLILINLVACAVLAVILLFTMNEKPVDCKNQCCSSVKKVNPEKIRAISVSETDEQMFQFNRGFIKI